MATDVTMPRLSDSMEEGTILKWLVEEGGEVKRGEPLVEIETDKANMTYEADTSGTLIEIVVDEGDTVPLGEVIARIGEEGEEPSGKEESEGESDEDSGDDDSADEDEDSGDDEGAGADEDEDGSEGGRDRDAAEQAVAKAGEAKEHAQEAKQALGGNGASSDGDRVKASPVARRVARGMGVEV